MRFDKASRSLSFTGNASNHAKDTISNHNIALERLHGFSGFLTEEVKVELEQYSEDEEDEHTWIVDRILYHNPSSCGEIRSDSPLTCLRTVFVNGKERRIPSTSWSDRDYEEMCAA